MERVEWHYIQIIFKDNDRKTINGIQMGGGLSLYESTYIYIYVKREYVCECVCVLSCSY